jgi:nucleoside-diphosphate-sugar epimerase
MGTAKAGKESVLMSTHKKRPILVTGGTGTLGVLLVPRLRDGGRQVRVLSRSPHESGISERVN